MKNDLRTMSKLQIGPHLLIKFPVVPARASTTVVYTDQATGYQLEVKLLVSLR